MIESLLHKEGTDRLFSISTSFCQPICSRVHNLDTCSTKAIIINRCARIYSRRSNLLRIVIDLPEGRYLFKDFVKVKRLTDRPLAV